MIIQSKGKITLSFKTSLVFVLCYLYLNQIPRIADQIIGTMSCKKLGEKFYQSKYLTLDCLDDSYIKYMLGAEIPAILIFFVFIPALLIKKL